MKTVWMGLFAVLFAAAAWADEPARAKISPEVFRRTAFLGDSITDGNTYPCLVRDALAGIGPMTAINAGIGGDTAAGMHKRLERDVLAFHPTLVTLSAGANDALRGVSADDYEKDVRAIAERLRDAHIPLILLTPNVLGPKQERGKANLRAYEAVLRRLAGEFGLRVAEVNQRQNEDAAAGHPQLAPDDLHPNYEGQRMIARAVLDAMGYSDVPVPQRVHNQPLPGLVREWKITPQAPGQTPLDEHKVEGLKPDDSWKTLALPETQPAPDQDSPNDRWIDDARGLGASVSLRQDPSRSHSFLGMKIVHAERPRSVQFHTGAELNAIWLNGKRIYHNDGTRGWHMGRESVPADLKAGDNSVLIETGPVFFLSITDGPMWEDASK